MGVVDVGRALHGQAALQRGAQGEAVGMELGAQALETLGKQGVVDIQRRFEAEQGKGGHGAPLKS